MANRVNVELSMNTTAYQKGIQQAIDSTEKYTSETRKVADAQVNLRKELAAAKKEVQNLAAGYARLDAAAKQSAFGKEMASKLEEVKQKAAEYIDLQGDLNQELKNMASDTHTLDMLSEGMGVLADATSAAMGITAQFTGNEEDAKRAVVAFTTAQSVLGTVTKLQNALQAQSNTMMAVSKVQTLAAAAATRIKVAAEGKNVVVTKAATAAQTAFNAVAKANPYVLLATGILAAVGAIYAFCSATNDASGEEEKLAKKAEETQKKLEEQRNTMLNAAKSSLETAANIDTLFISYKKANSEIDKKQILKNAQTEFKKLGYETKNLNEAHKLLIEHGPTVAKIIREQGVIAGLTALKMEAYSKSVKMLMENGYSVSVASILAESNKDFVELGKEIDRRTGALNKERAKLAKYEKKSGGQSGKKELKATENSVDAIQAKITNLQSYLKKGIIPKGFNNLKDVQLEIEKLTKQKNDLEIKLGLAKPDPKDIKGTEAWYREEIRKLEEQKALLPLDAYIEREQLQNQIDGLKLKVDLETKGFDITIDKANAAQEAKSIQDIINKALKGDGKFEFDFSSLDEDTKKAADKMLEEFNRIAEGRKQLQSIIDNPNSKSSSVEQATEGINLLTEAYNPLLEKLSEYQEKNTAIEEANKNLEKQAKAINKVGNLVASAGDAFKALGEATGSVELQVMGIVAQALATVALSFAQALSSCKTWVEWLAFGITGLATMMTMISQIKSVTSGGYAQGGIIPGNSYSGDRLLANVNSGEMILNQRQQKNLFNLLDTGIMPQGGGSVVQVEGVIHGTDILLVQKNTNKVRSRAGAAITF